MQLRSIGNALAIAILSIVLIVGSLSISLVEFASELTPTATNNIAEQSTPQPLMIATPTLEPLATALLLESPTASLAYTSTVTATQMRACAIPFGWGQTIVQIGDTVSSVAVRYRVTESDIRSANCLLTDMLVAGTFLHVPPVAANTAAMCNQGSPGWAQTYTVKSGDTIYSIAINHYTTAATLKSVNCRISDLIYAGEILWAPNVATRTPYPTPKPGETAIIYPTEPLTETALPFTLTPMPSFTPIPPTPTPIPTSTLPLTQKASPTVFP